jgi:hypothetical protein
MRIVSQAFQESIGLFYSRGRSNHKKVAQTYRGIELQLNYQFLKPLQYIAKFWQNSLKIALISHKFTGQPQRKGLVRIDHNKIPSSIGISLKDIP